MRSRLLTFTTVVVVLAIAQGAGCSRSDKRAEDAAVVVRHQSSSEDTVDAAKGSTFKCYKIGLMGGSWRECSPSLSRCEELGCFEREEAFCFPIVMVAFGSVWVQGVAAAVPAVPDMHTDPQPIPEQIAIGQAVFERQANTQDQVVARRTPVNTTTNCEETTQF